MVQSSCEALYEVPYSSPVLQDPGQLMVTNFRLTFVPYQSSNIEPVSCSDCINMRYDALVYFYVYLIGRLACHSGYLKHIRDSRQTSRLPACILYRPTHMPPAAGESQFQALLGCGSAPVALYSLINFEFIIELSA